MLTPGGKGSDGSPKVNVSSLIQRGNDLFAVCRRDRAGLEACGLRWNDVEELAGLVGACSAAESLWRLEREKRTKERLELDGYVAECRRFRNGVVGQLRIANGAMAAGFPVPQFGKNGGRADITQDLHDLHVLLRTYNRPRDGTPPVDPALGDQAYDRSQKLSGLSASAVLRRRKSDELKQQRDLLCTRMYALIQEICTCGRHFSKNDPRRQDYYNGKPRTAK